MKIDVYGAIFYDIYIYGEEPHKSEILEFPGGSGFNISYTLYKLGNEVYFNGVIGNDFKGNFLKEKTPFKNIKEIKNQETAVFISKNDIPLAVKRKINDIEFSDFEKHGEVAVITSEISIKNIEKILALNYDYIFIDIGPRPFLINDISFSENVFILGNENEAKLFNKKIDIIKAGIRGVYYNNKLYPSNGKKAKYTTGLGDIFDAFFIDNYIKNFDIENSVYNAITAVEKVLDIPTPYQKIESCT
ncbi:sugar kinase, ribokinase [Marinitoga piezophila KA3]|uniref:Sugar kinase, ribokinase n=1 Tax=Marinitoga piezophila (strain DSM 14283 / JCM 11233 / KA3) TaxID=443254 RepID=H2J5P4_MARPK|nr:PfkB family carbohydrate kinase [Marinitoga piezophila]AEX85030.1 sugar kinase, ribokinase [Marinitoga piezophila KA3]